MDGATFTCAFSRRDRIDMARAGCLPVMRHYPIAQRLTKGERVHAIASRQRTASREDTPARPYAAAKRGSIEAGQGAEEGVGGRFG